VFQKSKAEINKVEWRQAPPRHFVLRGDLRDRSVFLHLPAIPETRRQTERKFWPAFRADYPRILGGVLDAIVGGLRELPSVNRKSHGPHARTALAQNDQQIRQRTAPHCSPASAAWNLHQF
jgi:hypothetical protein